MNKPRGIPTGAGDVLTFTRMKFFVKDLAESTAPGHQICTSLGGGISNFRPKFLTLVKVLRAAAGW